MEDIDWNDILYKHIISRKDIPHRRISLRLMLRNSKTEEYIGICSDRIADDYLIDGEHIEIDFLDFPNLIFDCVGMMMCYEILSGYVSEEFLDFTWEYAHSTDHIIDGQNKQLALYRSCSIKNLLVMWLFAKKTLKKSGMINSYSDSVVKQISKSARLELFSRSIFHKMYLCISQKLIDLYFSVKYRSLVKIITNSFEKAIQDEKEHNNTQ